MLTLADMLRNLVSPNMTRNQLKVARARLRRLGVTNLSKVEHGPYAVDPNAQEELPRCESGAVLATVITNLAA